MKLTHVNHSSVICEYDDEFLLTDPWIFSNAFQGWYQYPAPHFETVKKILPSSSKLSIVLLSHAHDDHVDDIFLSQLSENIKVIIPKTNNPGFKNRLLKAGVNKQSIVEVDEQGIVLGNFKIAAFFDGSLSGEDFIFTISGGDTIFIHANDNWHEYTKITVDKIKKKLSDYDSKNIILMAQVGLADAFPLFYNGISSEEKKDFITKKVNYMCNSLISNSSHICIEKAYAYANQSKFSNTLLIDELGFDPYLLRDNIINKFSSKIIQLNPSDQINKGKFLKGDTSQDSIMKARLNNMQSLFAEYIKSKSKVTLDVEFQLMDDFKTKKDVITLYAGYGVWNDILNGLTNLEAIVTGGMGVIDKPLNYNMKEEYLLLTSWAYINQKNAKKYLNIPKT